MGSIQFINTLQQILHSDSTPFLIGFFRHLKWQWIRWRGIFPIELTFSKSIISVQRPSGVAALINCMNIYDFNNMNLLRIALSNREAVFFDVGANIGSYSIFTSEIAGSVIFSFEPHPIAFNDLLINIERNNRRNITPLRIALGDQEGKIFISNNPEISINRILESSDADENNPQVILRTLDGICQEHGVHPFVVKIDVEGYEKRVLDGFRKESADTLVFIIENGQNTEIRKTMRGMGLQGPWYFHFTRKSFSPFPQKRPEDPIYIRKDFIREMEKLRMEFH